MEATAVLEKPAEKEQVAHRPEKTAQRAPGSWVATGEALPELNINEITHYLPHRYPFLLVDRVTEHLQGKSIKGYKNITMNEACFMGHFPNNPIFPGVLQLEAMAQLGGVLIAHMPVAKGKLMVFAGIDGARFRRIVIPGDRLDMECELIKFRAPIGKSLCKAYVNGELAVEAELMFSLVDNPNYKGD